ncbi:MAG: dGTP triphosphohydrolase [Candidatus Methanomarinus sp.]|nr:MAG: dGTP triphosphohydrolase [ANME-2 cluster archaeon]
MISTYKYVVSGLKKKFELVNSDEYTKSIKLAEYATPYLKDEKRKFPEKPCDNRNAFIRDRDRILHCVSFRKLLGKTQMFISEKNPMQRNRLTHTMEVWQISVSIARMLKANIHLTEAIAFGHDLGHTPFGHAGEIVLNLLMQDKGLEGFSHNAQSVRVVSLLESNPNIIPLILGKPIPKWPKSIGLNLTRYTREGLFKHTSRFKKKECLFSWDEIPGNDNGKLIKFLKQKFGIEWVKTTEIEKIDKDNTIKVSSEKNHLSLNLNQEKTEVIFKIDDVRTDKFMAKMENGKLNIYGEYKHAKLIQEFREDYGSIEAQIVNISDEIAHHAHDLQDIWMAKIISEKEIHDIYSSFSTFLGKKPDKDKQIISAIIGKLINDVTAESIKKLNENYSGESGVEKFITFSEEGDKLIKYIEKIIDDNAILGDEVNKMNSRGRFIIKSLFPMFIKDPYCLPNEIKTRFSPNLQKKLKDTKGYEKIEVSNKEDIRVVCDYIASLTDKEAIDAFHSTLL